MGFRDLSLKYKVPLRGSLLIIITAITVSATLIAREYDDLKRDLVKTAESTGRVLGLTLVAPLLHDDLWRAFEIINAPLQPDARAGSPLTPDWLTVLDARQRVYVTSQPARFPLLAPAANVLPDYGTLYPTLARDPSAGPRVVDVERSAQLYMVTPISADGVLVGTLVVGYPRDPFGPRLTSIVKRASLVTLGVLVALIAASWYWAQRFATPLVRLADCMGRVGSEAGAELDCQLQESKDEIGRLNAAFRRMMQGLREKAALEKQVMLSERLAAVGRLSAGIAHEINNPLGGMLNAINTFRRHGNQDAMSLKTLSLLERGLTQIRETVAALLVEARVESHPLTPQDIEDTRTLVLADAQRKRARFVWDNQVTGPLPLPSTLVRQILLNLLFNAIQALDAGGRVECRIRHARDRLEIGVSNDGRYIPEHQQQYLFEPFSQLTENGHGLGLWVTYQIVQQLGGRISVYSQPGETRFTVEIPVRVEHESRASADAVPG